MTSNRSTPGSVSDARALTSVAARKSAGPAGPHPDMNMNDQHVLILLHDGSPMRGRFLLLSEATRGPGAVGPWVAGTNGTAARAQTVPRLGT